MQEENTSAATKTRGRGRTKWKKRKNKSRKLGQRGRDAHRSCLLNVQKSRGQNHGRGSQAATLEIPAQSIQSNRTEMIQYVHTWQIQANSLYSRSISYKVCTCYYKGSTWNEATDVGLYANKRNIIYIYKLQKLLAIRQILFSYHTIQVAHE